VSLQIAVALVIALPMLAVTQPFLGGFYTAWGVLFVLLALAVIFWRSAMSLEGHVRAGAQMVVEVLASQSFPEKPSPEPQVLHQVDRLLPGLGAVVRYEVRATSPVAGRTLADLNLRGVTGATVLALQRGQTGLSIPDAHETLRAGDVLALAGTDEALAAARAMLDTGQSGHD
jgi:CPA2 family monovalent cation:H+ antiporter-2